MRGSVALVLALVWLLMLVFVGIGITAEIDLLLAIGLIGYVAIPLGLIALAPFRPGGRSYPPADRPAGRSR
ncbi:MAG: hypothetical protein HY331_09625 [Chloroflexi bacterium]|nr:hypothetical protein [Chloroflexota bacterium]